MTLTEKILARASGKARVQAGDNVWVKADVLMTHDVCGPGTIGVFKREFGRNAKVWDHTKVVIIPDHYIFTIDDLKEIKKKFERMDAKNKIILTTEKDATRLIKFRDDINSLPLYVIPVRHHFLFHAGDTFNNNIIKFIENFKREE